MFISGSKKSELFRRTANLEYEYSRLNERYWELRRHMDLLLGHLGVYVDDVPKHSVIKTKGGPEKG